MDFFFFLGWVPQMTVGVTLSLSPQHLLCFGIFPPPLNTHSHTHTLSLTHTKAHTHSHTHSLSLSHTHTHTQAHTHKFTNKVYSSSLLLLINRLWKCNWKTLIKKDKICLFNYQILLASWILRKAIKNQGFFHYLSQLIWYLKLFASNILVIILKKIY